jgi:predicted transcriptional regulator
MEKAEGVGKRNGRARAGSIPMSGKSADHETLMTIAAGIVAAHDSHNHVSATDLPRVIESVFASLPDLGAMPVAPVPVQLPAVRDKKSVTAAHPVRLECGRTLKMLKQQIMTDHDLTPQDHRTKWGSNADYPMTAPACSAALTVVSGLGRKPLKGRKKKSTSSKRAAR